MAIGNTRFSSTALSFVEAAAVAWPAAEVAAEALWTTTHDIRGYSFKALVSVTRHADVRRPPSRCCPAADNTRERRAGRFCGSTGHGGGEPAACSAGSDAAASAIRPSCSAAGAVANTTGSLSTTWVNFAGCLAAWRRPGAAAASPAPKTTLSDAAAKWRQLRLSHGTKKVTFVFCVVISAKFSAKP